METLASAQTRSHTRLAITSTRADRIHRRDGTHPVAGHRVGIELGFVNIQTLHTTTAIVVNEGEPLLLSDFAALLEEAAPRDRRTGTTT